MLYEKKIADVEVLSPDGDHLTLFASTDGVLKQKDDSGALKTLDSLNSIQSNYLLNPYFRINQRGREIDGVKPWEVTEITSQAFATDRWYFSSGLRSGSVIPSVIPSAYPGEMPGYTGSLRLTINENYDNIANLGTADRRYIVQQIPAENVSYFEGKTLTFSVWFRSNVESNTLHSHYLLAFTNLNAQYAWMPESYVPGNWHKLSVTITIPVGATSIQFVAAINSMEFVIGQYIEIAAAQVVEGNTPAPHIPREDGVEMKLCQRFYENGKTIMLGTQNSTLNTHLMMYHSFMTPKRIVGTLNTKNLSFTTFPNHDYSILIEPYVPSSATERDLAGGDFIGVGDESGLLIMLYLAPYPYQERSFYWEAIAE